MVLPVEVELVPTAWQEVAEAQETLLRSLILEGRVSCVQAEPSKERATPVMVLVAVKASPTAWQEVAEAQETLLRLLMPEGKVPAFQAVPL
ncbi:MAG: hypothetical protein M1399_04260 [Actinobacteria bacterium]|nr:hypothetical protein [Actinomycetota bacterium]MCL5446952.1 hypothetical protein [Actinomycetota bacterium]